MAKPDPAKKQIEKLLSLLKHMLPHQQRRFVRWVQHYERTGEYLKHNFRRLHRTLKKHAPKPKPKTQPQLRLPMADYQAHKPTIIIKKKRRVINDQFKGQDSTST